MTVEIRPISAQQTHALRRRILRDGDPNAELDYEGDDHPLALHVGAIADGVVVGIASIRPQAMATRPDKRGWRLRGMATDEQWRRKGLGRKLLNACLAHIRQHEGEIFWCNGRTVAIKFYENMGFQTEGEEFMSFTGPHYVMWRAV